MYQTIVRPLLFRFDAEAVHRATIAACALAGRSAVALDALEWSFGTAADPRLATTVAGVQFPNPVGLAAGYDKSGEAVAALSCLGFGSIDVGSVSSAPSAGNTVRPRLARLPADASLMVYYGVPSDGAAVVAQRLRRNRPRVPLGVTVVETNTGHPAPAAGVIGDLTAACAAFCGIADVLYISAACPNGVGSARPFSDLDNLRRLFERLAHLENLPPVFLKIGVPDEQIERVIEIATPFPFLRGFRPAVELPKPYTGLRTPRAVLERLPGTATGGPLEGLTVAQIRAWAERIDPARFALIAQGGIRSGAGAYAAIRAGASLVGLVTALVYEGPGIARRINRELAALLQRDGFANVAAAVGADRRPRIPAGV